MRSITVVIAHPEDAIRTWCLRLLAPEQQVQVVAEARNGLETLASTAKLKPRILLLDLDLPRANGFTLLPAIHQKSPHTKVILLTRGASGTRILDALSLGALGYLEDKALGAFLAKAVRAVDAGEAWVPRKMVAAIVGQLACLRVRARPRVSWTKVHWTQVQ